MQQENLNSNNHDRNYEFDYDEFLIPKCKWTLNSSENEKLRNPHSKYEYATPKKIYDNILEAMINSPMVRLNKIPNHENVKCEILAKCEFLLPGGSTKDRIAKRMVEEAEKNGSLKPGGTIIEASSGNTAIALSIVGAVKGYNVLITMPEKMSQEKADIITSLGAQVLRTPTEARYFQENSHVGLAKRLNKQIENSLFVEQYTNENNALAHYDQTAEEIIDQCDGKIDYIVISVGTGGTLTGIGRKLKERIPDVKIIAIDPIGSVIAYPDELNQIRKPFKVEGIGKDFVPRNCDRVNIVDKWLKSDDKTSFYYSRRLIREEGLLVGGSSGAVLWGALQIAKELELGPDKRVVCLFIDSIRNYITKFLNDDWLLENNFLNQEEYDKKYIKPPNKLFGEEYKICDLNLKELIPIQNNTNFKNLIEYFDKQRVGYLPVLDGEGNLIGIITKKQTINFLATYRKQINDPIASAVIKEFKKLNYNDPLKYLSRGLLRTNEILIVDENNKKFYLSTSDDLIKCFVNN